MCRQPDQIIGTSSEVSADEASVSQAAESAEDVWSRDVLEEGDEVSAAVDDVKRGSVEFHEDLLQIKPYVKNIVFFRLHRMHEMQTIVTDVCLSVRPSVHQSVCLTVTRLNSALLCGAIRCSLCQITLASCLSYFFAVLTARGIYQLIKFLFYCNSSGCCE